MSGEDGFQKPAKTVRSGRFFQEYALSDTDWHEVVAKDAGGTDKDPGFGRVIQTIIIDNLTTDLEFSFDEDNPTVKEVQGKIKAGEGKTFRQRYEETMFIRGDTANGRIHAW